jgi:cellulose synthase/poly-beta-1,6-N-acetylglucosamine synthase-like glycosyltransferase
MWYTLFRLVFVVVFVGLHCGLMVGLFREWHREHSSRKMAPGTASPLETTFPPEPVLPSVSVIVPIRNEAHCLAGLLESLEAQDYPKAEYIFIDDRSVDESTTMLSAFQHDSSLKNIKVITLAENPGPNHKQYALSRGINVANGDFFLFTDAVCVVPRGWVSAMLVHIREERVGAVIAPVF